MKFAEFHTGQVIEAGPFVLTETELLSFANAWDPQWFHTDADAALTGPFQGLIASGWQTCAIAMRMVVTRILADSESYGSPGLAYLKWENPVRPGDMLYLTLDVLERRVATSKPTLGIVRWRWRMRNQVAALVLDLEATSLFDLASKEFKIVTGSAPA